MPPPCRILDLSRARTSDECSDIYVKTDVQHPVPPRCPYPSTMIYSSDELTATPPRPHEMDPKPFRLHKRRLLTLQGLSTDQPATSSPHPRTIYAQAHTLVEQNYASEISPSRKHDLGRKVYHAITYELTAAADLDSVRVQLLHLLTEQIQLGKTSTSPFGQQRPSERLLGGLALVEIVAEDLGGEEGQKYIKIVHDENLVLAQEYYARQEAKRQEIEAWMTAESPRPKPVLDTPDRRPYMEARAEQEQVENAEEHGPASKKLEETGTSPVTFIQLLR